MLKCDSSSSKSDMEFVELLYNQYHRLIFFTVRKYELEEGRCEDIAQDCLVKLTEKVKTLRTLSDPALVSYIVATAKNTAISHVRRQRYDQKMIVHFEDLDTNLTSIESIDLSLDDIIIKSEAQEQIRAVWPKLDEETKRVLEGKYYLEYDDKELAQVLGVKPSSIRMKLTRARRAVLKLLTEGEKDD